MARKRHHRHKGSNRKLHRQLLDGSLLPERREGWEENPSLVSGRYTRVQLYPLASGKVMVLDTEDWKALSHIRWSVHHAGRNTQYASTVIRHQGESLRFYCHDLVLRLHEPSFVPGLKDLCNHINRQGLDNTSKNLRWADPSINQLNRGKHG